MHMMSPMSKGLVHRVIAQSGCALNAWNRGSLGTGRKIAEIFGIADKPTAEIIQQLQQIPMEKFLRKTQAPSELIVRVDVPIDFSPVVETQTNEPAFLPKPIIDMISEPSNNIPLMFGYNNNDMLVFQVTRRLFTGGPFLFSDLKETIPSDLDLTDKERVDLVSSIRSTFFELGSTNLTTDVDAVSKFALGPWFIAGYLQSIEKHLAANNDVYFYVFASDTRLNFFKRQHPITTKYSGACHMDELGYLFRISSAPCFARNSLEEKSLRQTIKIWTNFARYGKPSSDKDTFQSNKVTDLNDIVYLNISNDEVKESREPNKKIWNFWRNVYRTYNRVSN